MLSYAWHHFWHSRPIPVMRSIRESTKVIRQVGDLQMRAIPAGLVYLPASGSAGKSYLLPERFELSISRLLSERLSQLGHGSACRSAFADERRSVDKLLESTIYKTGSDKRIRSTVDCLMLFCLAQNDSTLELLHHALKLCQITLMLHLYSCQQTHNLFTLSFTRLYSGGFAALPHMTLSCTQHVPRQNTRNA